MVKVLEIPNLNAVECRSKNFFGRRRPSEIPNLNAARLVLIIAGWIAQIAICWNPVTRYLKISCRLSLIEILFKTVRLENNGFN